MKLPTSPENFVNTVQLDTYFRGDYIPKFWKNGRVSSSYHPISLTCAGTLTCKQRRLSSMFYPSPVQVSLPVSSADCPQCCRLAVRRSSVLCSSQPPHPADLPASETPHTDRITSLQCLRSMPNVRFIHCCPIPTNLLTPKSKIIVYLNCKFHKRVFVILVAFLLSLRHCII